MSEKNCSCPRCKSSSSLVTYWTLFLSLEEWPSALIALSFVMLSSQILNLSPETTALFSIISIIPLVFALSKKESCLDCGIDFDTPSRVKVK
jgi:Mn2+/Fe2+ NRAMP family transporter